MTDSKAVFEEEKNLSETAIEKQRAHQKKRYLTPLQILAYNISGMGDKNYESFSGANSFFFNYTFLGANAITLATANTFSSIIDTVDNAISGPLIDRTRTRWGRVRPYLILTLPFWVFSAATPWILPGGMSQTALMLWFFALNYIGSIAGSFYNPSYAALLYNLTPNVEERNLVITTDTYLDLLGVWLPSLFPFFVDYLPASIETRNIYTGGAFFFIFFVIVFRIFGFFTLRERIPLATRQEMKQTSVWKSLRQVATCRPMWVLTIKTFFGLGKGVGGSVANFFWLNCTGKLSNATISGFVTGLPSYFVLPLAPKLTKKLGLRNLAAICYGICGLSYIIMWLVGYEPFGKGKTVLNLAWITFILTVAGSLNSIQRYTGTAMTGDMYDYVEWKTGIRNEGMLSATMSYLNWGINSLANIISAFIIDAIGYVPLFQNGINVPQTDPKMLAGIWAVFCLGPGIGRSLKAITLMFFNVHGKTKERMMEDLARIRAAKIIDTERPEDAAPTEQTSENINQD